MTAGLLSLESSRAVRSAAIARGPVELFLPGVPLTGRDSLTHPVCDLSPERATLIPVNGVRCVTPYISRSMTDASAKAQLDEIVSDYRRTADVPVLLSRLDTVARSHASEDLVAALGPYLGLNEVAGPVFEVIVEREPGNARALVGLANAYWLSGRGPDVVSALAERARTADPNNRAAWHLWALSESSPRDRMGRWQRVVERFPEDDLARVNLADNAASVAGAEDDPVALKLAVATYEVLRSTATRDDQRAALDKALTALRNFRK
jgi:hypothetical protein